MLMVKIVNTGDGTDEVANYKYEVYVNTRCIATGLVNGHVRGDGWQKLVHAVARDAEQHISSVQVAGSTPAPGTDDVRHYLIALKVAQQCGDKLDGAAFNALFPAQLQLGDIIIGVEEYLRE